MTTPHRRRIRAVRHENPETTIATKMSALRALIGATPEQRLATLRRLLRQERRAAQTGLGYDASRHAALRRLLGEIEPPRRQAIGNEKGRHATHDGPLTISHRSRRGGS